MRFFTLLLALVIPSSLTFAEPYSAAQLIAAVKAAKPKGGLLVRARMEQEGAGKRQVLNLQIKRRDTADGHTEQLFQLTFPKERKGEALLLRTKKGTFTAKLFIPGQEPKTLGAKDKRTPVFGTDMTLEDALADFLDWQDQRTTGQEKVHGAECSVIESRPPGGGTPSLVRSWIENKRYVAWRVQVFDGGNQPARVVEAEEIIRAESGYFFPRTFKVSTPAAGTSTTVAGTSSSEQEFSDADFSDASIQAMGAKK